MKNRYRIGRKQRRVLIDTKTGKVAAKFEKDHKDLARYVCNALNVDAKIKHDRSVELSEGRLFGMLDQKAVKIMDSIKDINTQTQSEITCFFNMATDHLKNVKNSVIKKVFSEATSEEWVSGSSSFRVQLVSMHSGIGSGFFSESFYIDGEVVGVLKTETSSNNISVTFTPNKS